GVAGSPVVESAPVPTPTPFAVPADLTAWQAAPVVLPEAARLVAGVSVCRFQGLDALRVETADASAVISLHGAQLLSYVPRGGQEVFWLSPLRAPLPTPIRGGTPVCWPFFGRQGQGG